MSTTPSVISVHGVFLMSFDFDMKLILVYVFWTLAGRTPKCGLAYNRRWITDKCSEWRQNRIERKVPYLYYLGNVMSIKEVKEPIIHQPLIYDESKAPPIESPIIPMLIDLGLPALHYVNENKIVGDLVTKEEKIASSLIKKRRKKMNKHKYKKRIDRDIAKIRKIRGFRLKKKRRRQAHKKRLLIKKLDKVLKTNPKCDLLSRPYVVYRLKNW